MNDVAITHFLKPIQPFLDEEGVAEISINKTKEIWVEKFGQMQRLSRDVFVPLTGMG